MSRSAQLEVHVFVEDSGKLSGMADEVRAGLLESPKRLPSKYFYDERGSRLFERITELPEYYLTRAETRLLEQRTATIMQIVRPEELLELGSGAASKTRILLEAGRAVGTLSRYVPLEVSRDIAERAGEELVDLFPGLEIHAIVGDFEAHLDEVPHGGLRLVAVLGSTIGNFATANAVELLNELSTLFAEGDYLLLGTDLVKERSRLEAAYNDSAGVTGEFNRNILHVVNKHLGGNFDPDQFDHVAKYNEADARIESSLRSNRRQTVRLDALEMTISLERGEMIHTEISCKYSRESLTGLLALAGFRLEHWFPDEAGDYALSLARFVPD